ncbi:MAG: inositol monophosphatase family protein [Gammaproteobacteria bacterium]|nr:inositol monophosphatase family protein [Gammaproteobacteria bacterium]
MQPMANMALRAARMAGQRIARAFDRPDTIKVSEKGKNDFVTNIDREVEYVIIETLREKYPGHAFLGEEGGNAGDETDSDYEWVIDPIDGTYNFVRGIPHFCVSIGCINKGRLEHGVILDPLRNEEFVASRGYGCQLNGRRVRVNQLESLDGACLTTGGRENLEIADKQSQIYLELLSSGAKMRQAGSAALDLAYVASGRLDGMWMRQLSLWDMAAGILMVTEAGGLVGDFEGGSQYLKSGNVVAASPRVFRTLAPIVKTHLAGT